MGRLSTSSEAVLTADPGFAEELSAESKAGSMDVYLSAVAPYSVEQMLIHKNEFEHWPDGKEIRGYNEDKQSQGIFYKEGYFRFGRSIFTVPWKDDKELSWVREGKLASNDLFYEIAEAFEYLTTSWLGSIHSWDFDKEQTQLIYFDAAAKYIGTIRHTPCKDVESYVLGGPYYLQYSWESILGDGEYTPDNIVKLFKAEKKKFHADKQVMHRMKLAKWRMDRGWWNQYQ